MLWYQKSREKWVKFGDKNTAFFHTQTIVRRKRNRVHRLQLPCGTWSSDSDTLQQEAQNYFKLFFTASQDNRDRTFTEGTHLSITEEGRNSLTAPITKNEVYAAFNSMKPYKAPGPDGFHCIFFKQYWHIVGNDIYHMVQTAFQTGHFDPEISNTLIALIPKIDPPTTYKDFRPISLCNITYKIITTVLVHRLRPILTNIIGPYQSSFLLGRGTADNSIVLQEIIHFMKHSKRKKGYVAYKLDLEKAFDNVNWDFLSNCLHDFGFPNITIKFIMHCVASPSYSILWNGNKLPPFKPSHGLRQGDTLSPYLFILCMEKLSAAINSAVAQGRWAPIQITPTGPHLSHLLFADDVLLISKAKTSQVHLIHDLFERFSQASGLRINIAKSRAFTRQALLMVKSLASLQYPESKAHPHLASRLTLATSVLSSIPTYYMQINWLPQSICDSIDQTTRNFFWKDTNNKGVNLVNWKKLTTPKQSGGLGIRRAREANTCLLGKLVWDMVQSTNKLWVNILSNKYTTGSNILQATCSSNSSPTWSSIIKAKNVLRNGYLWRAGSGTSSFWFHNWSPHGLIGSHVPIIDIHDIQLTVKDVFTHTGQHTHALYTNLPPAIADYINNTNFRFNERIENTIIWSHNINGVYTANCGYAWLLRNSDTDTNPLSTHSWSWIWKLKSPEKFKLLIWLACHNAIPTMSLLEHRHMAPLPPVLDVEKTKKPLCIAFGIVVSPPLFGTGSVSRIPLFSTKLFHQAGSNNTLPVTTLPFSFPVSGGPGETAIYSVTAQSSQTLVRWNNSNFSGVVLNVDGSCLGAPIRAGYRGILRNSVGFFLQGFSGFIEATTDILFAELTAIHKGLLMAAENGIEEMICYTDSLLSVKLLTNSSSRFHAYAVLIQDIQDLLLSTNFSIQHCHREGNQCADFMAKLGAISNEEFARHTTPPYDLIPLIRLDAMGTAFPRA
ncbi:uncharacterized protein [Medicago truncatula]|uniref:uncharacterized protein n=1 Tax=Medicago truncatula TaxID=3880 RepID=UPI001967E53C|nr:uncharacterized protein LOC112420083 [Medicago truncatula]